MDDGLATTMHSMRAMISIVLKASPGSLAFSCNTLLNVPLIAEWTSITCNQEALMNDAVLKSNQGHISYYYCVSQQVLKYNNTIKGRLTVKTSGPFDIVQVHNNGVVTIQN